MSFITNITSTPATTGSFTDGTPTAMDNDHGNIRAAGNISETGLFSSNSLGEGNPITLVSSGVHNKIAVNGGTWNFQDGSGVIVRATTSLGGVANNAALFGASDSSNGDSIHQSAVEETDYTKLLFVQDTGTNLQEHGQLLQLLQILVDGISQPVLMILQHLRQAKLTLQPILLQMFRVNGLSIKVSWLRQLLATTKHVTCGNCFSIEGQRDLPLSLFLI